MQLSNEAPDLRGSWLQAAVERGERRLILEDGKRGMLLYGKKDMPAFWAPDAQGLCAPYPPWPSQNASRGDIMDLQRIDTEKSNPLTAHIDQQSTLGMLQLINQQDALVAAAVEKELPHIVQAVDLIHGRLAAGGRLVYMGSGTSGRLGVLDAAECPPTYGVDPGVVVALIAGGPPAILRAVEGAEDDRAAGEKDLRAMGFGPEDALVGIAASGRTPYVLGGMEYAASLGAAVIGLACTQQPQLAVHAQVMIAPLCGPEVITGSTRMKSGTAQKMVLNMLSTAVMIKLGKVWGSLMVDVKVTNQKLLQRAVNILVNTTGATPEEAKAALDRCNGSTKTAIVCLRCGLAPQAAREVLEAAGGHIATALQACGDRA